MRSTMLCRRRRFRLLAERGSAIPTGLAALRIGGICGQFSASFGLHRARPGRALHRRRSRRVASVMFCASDNASHSVPSPVAHLLALDHVWVHVLCLVACVVPSDHVQAVSRSWSWVGLRVDEPCFCSANEHTCCSVDGVVEREIPSAAVCDDVVRVFDIARLQCPPCSTRARASPHGVPRMCAHAPCAHFDTLGHRGQPLIPCHGWLPLLGGLSADTMGFLIGWPCAVRTSCV